MAVKYFCDRCGGEFNSKDEHVYIWTGENFYYWAELTREFMFCLPCSSEFLTDIKNTFEKFITRKKNGEKQSAQIRAISAYRDQTA
jgi:hypothetical protein